MIARNIVLSEEDFETASQKLSDIATRMDTLKEKVSDMLEKMRSGFNTEAGRKFIQACNGKLIRPLQQQAAVMNNISQTLNTVKADYGPVFTEYRQLNTAIKDARSGQ